MSISRILFDNQVEPCLDRSSPRANPAPNRSLKGDPTVRFMVLVKADKNSEGGRDAK